MSESPDETQKSGAFFIVTKSGKGILRYFLAALAVLFVAAMLIFNWQLLTENPFSAKMHWDIPILADRNIHGETAVLDRSGKRIVVLERDGQIRSIIRANPLTKRSISCASDIAIDDHRIYVLDVLYSPNGAQINGERILVYDLDGHFLETAYEISHPDATQRDLVLCDVSCYNGKIFVSKREQEKVSAFQIVDGETQEVQSLSFPGKDIFSATFMPDTKSTFVVTRDACYYLCYQNDTEEIPGSDAMSHWNDLCISPSGERYYLDSNKHEIIRLRPNVKKKELIQLTSRDEIKKITDCHGMYLSLQDDVLLWCNIGRNEVVSFNVASGKKEVSVEASQTPKYIAFRCFVWLCAVAMFIFLTRNIINVVAGIVKSFRRHHGYVPDQPKDQVSIWELYGKNAFALTFAFLAITFVLSFFFVEREWYIMESSARATASELNRLPGKVFGDYLADISSPSDYNSKSFRILKQVGNSICFSSESAEFDLGFSVFRRLPNGSFMYVIDTFDRYCMGKIIDKNDPDLTEFHEKLQSITDEKIHAWDWARMTGKSVFYACARIFDSNGKEAGIVMVTCNKEQVYEDTRKLVAKLSVDLFLLFIIFVFLCGEINLSMEFRKFRQLQPGTGKLLQTVCEGHRPCQFLTTMLLYLDAAFLPTLAAELAQRSGVGYGMNFSAALSLSCRWLMLVVALAVGGFFAKYMPRKCLKGSALVSVLLYLFQIYTIYCGQFFPFLISVAALGVMHGLNYSSLDAISSSGLQPHSKFKNLVFVNTEYLIGAAVGTSVGSLLCADAGYISVFVLGVLLEFVLVFVAGFFIADDINVKAERPAEGGVKSRLAFDWAKIKHNAKHILRPDMLTLLFCVMVPISILSQFDSYVLPIYNAEAGYSQLLTGFLGSVTKILALLLIPYTFNKFAERGNRFPLLAGMLLLILGMIFFVYDTSLVVMSVLLLLTTMFYIVFVTTSERLRAAAAAQDRVAYSEVSGVALAFQYLGSAAAPLFMELCIRHSFRMLGLVCAGWLAVCLILFLIFSSRLCRAKLGKCL